MNISKMFEGVVKITARTSGADAVKALGGDISSVGKRADAVNQQVAGLTKGLKGLTGAFAGVSAAAAILEMSRATIQLDAYQAQLRIGFGTATANMELKALRATMVELGISQEENLGMAVRYTTALKLSGKTAGEANTIFRDTAKIILSNKLNAEDASRVFKAMMQTASKGKLMSEELTGQLGDTLAGYMQQIAGAMGISSGELMARMKDGKVAAEDYFNAVKKVADGIDDAKLNSAARSLGNLKNAFFDLKSSAISVDLITHALDATTGAMRFLANSATALRSILALAGKALAVFLSIQAVNVAIAVYGRMVLVLIAARDAAILYAMANAHLSVTQLALGGTTRALGVAFAAMGGWVTVAAVAIVAVTSALMGYTTRHKEADAAADAFSRSQSALAGVIDITTGKINTQNQALLENARLLAKAALIKARDAETEARGNMERKLNTGNAFGNTSVANAASGTFEDYAPDAGRAAIADLVSRSKAGTIATADLNRELENTFKRFPGLRAQYGDLTKQVLALSNAELQSRDAVVANMLVMGQRDKMTADQVAYATARGLLAGDVGSLPPAAPSAAAGAGSKADPYGDRMEALGGKLAQLMAQKAGFDAYGEGVAHAEEALAVFETTSGRFARESAAHKAALIERARAVDSLKASIEAAEAASKIVSDQAKDRAQLEFAIKYAEKYGESAGRAREALVMFEIEHGKLKDASAAVTGPILAEARALDTLARRAKEAKMHFEALKVLHDDMADWQTRREDAALEAGRFDMSGEDFARAKEKIAFERDLKKKTSSMLPQDAADYEFAARRALELYQAEEALRRQRENTPLGGMREALHAYGEELGNTGKKFAEVWGKALRGTEDALVNFVTTGKLSFKELAGSIIADLARIAIQALVMVPITNWLKTITGGAPSISPFALGAAFMPANDNFSGGVVKRYANGDVFNSPQRFSHAGGQGVMAEAGPEAVMPLKRMGNGRLGVEFSPASGGGSKGDVYISVEVNVDADGRSATAVKGDAPGDLGKMLGEAVRREIVNQQRPGGLLAA